MIINFAFCSFFQIQNRNWRRLRKVVEMFFKWCMKNLNDGLLRSSHMPASVEYEPSLPVLMARSKMQRNLYYFLNDLYIATGIYKWLALVILESWLVTGIFFLFPGNQRNKRGCVEDLRCNIISSLVIMALEKFQH